MEYTAFAQKAPIYIDHVGLRSSNAQRLASFYQWLLGLVEIGRQNQTIQLGVADRLLLEIEQFDHARQDNPREAGLFHIAFLLPSRADLARFFRHVLMINAPITGASDHDVSEAIYFQDIDGNGVEVYSDRPENGWQWQQGLVKMGTRPLDHVSLLKETGRQGNIWQGAPENTVIGHVHLRVGLPAQAQLWWHDMLGFDAVQHYGDQAVFLSTGGYHHHVACNSWTSFGAGMRANDRAGLSFVSLCSQKRDVGVFLDPWGNEIRLTA